MKIYHYPIVAGAALFCCLGCTTSQPSVEKSAFIVMKTPKLKYADQGFIAKGPTMTKVEIYASGTPLMRLKIRKDQICTGGLACLGKATFNKKYLSAHYPDDTLGEIFRGEQVFDGVNVTTEDNGFRQTLSQSGRYDINYSVINGSIIFRDTVNNILIKVRPSG